MASQPSNPYVPDCPYCGRAAVFFPTSERFYGQDLGPLFACDPCDARVGAHRATLKPLGRLANRDLRRLKVQAHALFDLLWKGEGLREAYADEFPSGVIPERIERTARTRAYLWLAQNLCISPVDCHIAAFDETECLRALHVLEVVHPTASTVRTWWKARRQSQPGRMQ